MSSFVSLFGKISAQPHTTLCIQFLDRENNDKNNTLPLGKQICFTIVWGCEEILPPIQPLTRISVDFGLLARHGRKLPLETTGGKEYGKNTKIDDLLLRFQMRPDAQPFVSKLVHLHVNANL